MKYHREVFFEAGIQDRIVASLQQGSELAYTRHAQLQTIKDRYGIVPVLKKANLRSSDIFEYVKENGVVVKAVFRIDWLSEKFSYSYSVSLDGNVVTCWANDKTDKHSTLDRKVYAAA